MDPLTDYVLDTVGLVHYLDDSLPRSADRAVGEAEDGGGRLFLPEIVLGEFVYVALRGRLRSGTPRALVEEFLDQLRGSAFLVPSTMGLAAWRRFVDLAVPELHDRMIAADALARGVAVVTNDLVLASLPGLRTVWR